MISAFTEWFEVDLRIAGVQFEFVWVLVRLDAVLFNKVENLAFVLQKKKKIFPYMSMLNFKPLEFLIVLTIWILDFSF